MWHEIESPSYSNKLCNVTKQTNTIHSHIMSVPRKMPATMDGDRTPAPDAHGPSPTNPSHHASHRPGTTGNIGHHAATVTLDGSPQCTIKRRETYLPTISQNSIKTLKIPRGSIQATAQRPQRHTRDIFTPTHSSVTRGHERHHSRHPPRAAILTSAAAQLSGRQKYNERKRQVHVHAVD